MNIADLPRPIIYARQTFFRLLLSGYASGVTQETVPRFKGDPGTKRNIWKDEAGWLGIDEWRTSTLGDGSNGTTSIYQNKTLVWEMQYGGSYPKHVIPFLREVLLHSYSRNIWYGGRGQQVYWMDKYRYFNKLGEGSDFTSFSGQETIEEVIAGVWTPVGTHHYRGGFLY